MVEYFSALKMIDEMVEECLNQHQASKNEHVRAMALARAGALRGLARWIESEIKLKGRQMAIELTREMIVGKGPVQ